MAIEEIPSVCPVCRASHPPMGCTPTQLSIVIMRIDEHTSPGAIESARQAYLRAAKEIAEAHEA